MGDVCDSVVRHKCLTQGLPPLPARPPADALNNAKSVLSSADLLKKGSAYFEILVIWSGRREH